MMVGSKVENLVEKKADWKVGNLVGWWVEHWVELWVESLAGLRVVLKAERKEMNWVGR